MLKSRTETLQAELSCTVDTYALGEGLVAFKITRSAQAAAPVTAMFVRQFAETVHEGLAKEADIAAFLEGTATRIEVLKGLGLFDSLLPKLMQELGFSAGLAATDDKISSALQEQPFTQFVSGQASLEQLVRLDISNHMLFDRHGEVLPVALYFDYIEAAMRDGRYNLERAAEILKKDSRVRFIAEKPQQDPTEVIHEVPYYNAEPGKTKYLQFLFMPTEADQRQLWKQQQSYGTKSPSLEKFHAVFDLDMLGLRAGGAALQDSFFVSSD
jgi:hypothetical protein